MINTFDKGVLSIVSGSNDQMSITNTIAQNAENISYQNLRNDLGISMIDPECVMEIKTDILTEDDFIFKIINKEWQSI